MRQQRSRNSKSAVFLGTLERISSFENQCAKFYSPVKFGILPELLSQPNPDAEILSVYEEDVSSMRDRFSAWVKSHPETKLHRHIVDAKGANPAFREVPVRKHSPSKEEYSFDACVPNRLTEQKRLSIYSGNPGSRSGKGAIEKHIAGKWHIITFQKAIVYLDSEYLTNRFYVSHCGGCAFLFNKDTFHQDIKVTSVYLHDTMTGIHTYTDLRGGQDRARRGGEHAVCVGTVPDHDCGGRVEECTGCVREPVGEHHTLAMIAYAENMPRWHNERRQARVNLRSRSSPISAIRKLQLLKRTKPVGNHLQEKQQF